MDLFQTWHTYARSHDMAHEPLFWWRISQLHFWGRSMRGFWNKHIVPSNFLVTVWTQTIFWKLLWLEPSWHGLMIQAWKSVHCGRKPHNLAQMSRIRRAAIFLTSSIPLRSSTSGEIFRRRSSSWMIIWKFDNRTQITKGNPKAHLYLMEIKTFQWMFDIIDITGPWVKN